MGSLTGPIEELANAKYRLAQQAASLHGDRMNNAPLTSIPLRTVVSSNLADNSGAVIVPVIAPLSPKTAPWSNLGAIDFRIMDVS